MKMLMEIGPLLMRGALVMTMAMISPSGREVSPAEQPRQNPRLAPPCGGGVSSEKMACDYFPIERVHIVEDGHRRATRGPRGRGAPRGVGCTPHPRGQGVAPLVKFLRSMFFYIFGKHHP